MKHLRNKPIELSDADAEIMVQKYGFYDRIWNYGGKGIKHAYEKQSNGQVVYDRATSLYWQQSGSSSRMNYDEAHTYVDQLNSNRYGGYHDWRLPTLEEAMSLMEPEEKNGGLYIDPIFDPAQRWIWTADKTPASRFWYVYFFGICHVPNVAHDFVRVRAVRS